MARRGRSEPTALGQLLAALSGRPQWQHRLEGAQVHLRWSEIVGEQLARHTEPVRLAAGVLVVRTPNALWATEVASLSGMLAARANEVLGTGQVLSVRVVHSELRGESEDR